MFEFEPDAYTTEVINMAEFRALKRAIRSLSESSGLTIVSPCGAAHLTIRRSPLVSHRKVAFSSKATSGDTVVFLNTTHTLVVWPEEPPSLDEGLVVWPAGEPEYDEFLPNSSYVLRWRVRHIPASLIGRLAAEALTYLGLDVARGATLVKIAIPLPIVEEFVRAEDGRWRPVFRRLLDL